MRIGTSINPMSRCAEAVEVECIPDKAVPSKTVEVEGVGRATGGDEQGQLLRRVLRLRHALQEVTAYGIWGSKGRCTGPPGP